MDKHSLLKSYCQPDEKLLLAKVLDQADLSLRKHSVLFSDFLSPVETARACDILKHVSDLKFSAFGGYEDSERKMISFYHDYIDYEIVFPISAIKIEYNTKFSSGLNHRDFLGSILGLGIERLKVGDIILAENYAVCFAENSIAEYIISNLQTVGRTKVSTKKVEYSEEVVPQKNIVEKNITVASLRADVVFGAIFGEQRSHIQQMINAEKAYINWIPAKNSSSPVKEGDVLSLKGSGRGILLSVNGETKKGRISLTVGRYV